MDRNDYIREDIAAIRKFALKDPDGRPIYDAMADNKLVLHASEAMRQKLQSARASGRCGWWNADECTLGRLRSMLQEHVDKGDMRDVLNLAAMIYVREIADARPGAGSPTP